METDPRRSLAEVPGPLIAAVACALLLAVTGGAVAAGTQEERAPACDEPEHRQFDYWIGDWVVRNPDGEQVGTNTISRISAGCALLEQWQAVNGSPGNSINFYDPAREAWRQTWVGGGGQVLDLEGGLEDGVMTLYGDRTTDQGPVRDRIRWVPHEDGRVEQAWDISSDEGRSWATVFRGFYEPAGE